MDKSREQFEAWASHAFGEYEVQLDIDQDGDYTDEYDVNYVNDAWDAWQASRAAIEVDLPFNDLISDETDLLWEKAVQACADSITSLGIKVKQ